ncbi:DUF3466 family protein [Permianibacter aggregans]|uniref:Putative secreted protein n=1 Tax=Permianibacter aggregans TaxID=1510150 RepID=A0A4R6UL01_9GAMM|nr:DUF3466 family protein [Permianibacter aggregans]QGX38918.1 DUF3466 family protein [Permianibacter aggregans]TDQ46836.1 putative secreted protein [Permianibacter aggregans]
MLLRITALAALVAGASCHAATKYDVIDLGTLGGDYAFAFGLNNQGHAVGNAQGPVVDNVRQFSNHAFIWNGNATPMISDLGNLGKDGSYARAISDSGLVVGYANKVTATSETGVETILERGFKVVPGSAMEMLPTPALPTQNMRAYDIALDETIVGAVDVTIDNAQITRGYILPAGASEPVLVNALSGGQGLVLRGVNSVAGKAVGFNQFDASTSRPLMVNLADPTVAIELTSLGGIQAQAYAVNDHSQIAGYSWNADNTKINAVVFQPGDSSNPVVDLGQLVERFNSSAAYDINNLGQVVGTARSATTGSTHSAFLYELNASTPVMQNLNDLIDCNADVSQRWHLVSAQSVNENGEIVGYGTKGNLTRAFLLRPSSDTTPPVACPEPPPFEDKNEAGSVSGFTALLALPMLFWRRRKI